MSRWEKVQRKFGEDYWKNENGEILIEKTDISGRLYLEDKEGNRTYQYERDSFQGSFIEDQDGNRQYIKEDYTGRQFLEDQERNRIYIGKDRYGNEIRTDDENIRLNDDFSRNNTTKDKNRNSIGVGLNNEAQHNNNKSLGVGPSEEAPNRSGFTIGALVGAALLIAVVIEIIAELNGKFYNPITLITNIIIWYFVIFLGGGALLIVGVGICSLFNKKCQNKLSENKKFKYLVLALFIIYCMYCVGYNKPLNPFEWVKTNNLLVIDNSASKEKFVTKTISQSDGNVFVCDVTKGQKYKVQSDTNFRLWLGGNNYSELFLAGTHIITAEGSGGWFFNIPIGRANIKIYLE